MFARDEARRARRRARYERWKRELRGVSSAAPSQLVASRIAALEARLARTKGRVERAGLERELAALRESQLHGSRPSRATKSTWPRWRRSSGFARKSSRVRGDLVSR
jgi:hypothetical protein